MYEHFLDASESRMSEYKDPFRVLAQLGADNYLKFNRIPEVLVMDHDKKDEVPMSFHDLHLFGNTAVLQVITTPRAYKHNKPLSWDFWLISIKVLGKKHESLALSPSKAVQKRKSVFLSDNRPMSPLKPASTSRTRQKQRAGSMSSFIDDATQEESEEEEEEEGERAAEPQVEEGEVSEVEASDDERPPSPVQQKVKTVKRTRNRPRTSKTRQPPALECPDTNEGDPDVQDGTNEEALTAPVGVPTRLPCHAMLRDPNFSAHAGSGYIFVNRTGSMLNIEDLLETNHSFSGTVDRSVCSTCATDTHYRSCVYQGPGKQCNRCHTAGRHCSFEMSLDRLEIFSQGVNHIVQQSSPSINHQIQCVLAINELTATASNNYLRLNRYREEEIAQLQRQLTDVPRLLWQIELSNPDFELDDDKLRELSLTCGRSSSLYKCSTTTKTLPSTSRSLLLVFGSSVSPLLVLVVSLPPNTPSPLPPISI
ncbi:hypothetical protein K435DRAFT_804526 [Dendrothele bispora CBS 962.96]|uniref:Uncharacterized protein n=1 Tax=Dendrothele bispora (strain CBS 962.96) TaxID=1314807 RepID=A0A4S8LE03_DENBC|nr:hypothetical protein K435DRAFT_804526 [Dendrothele bispora CBS 962.96]